MISVLTKVTELASATWEHDYDSEWLEEDGGGKVVRFGDMFPDHALESRGHYRITVEFVPAEPLRLYALRRWLRRDSEDLASLGRGDDYRRQLLIERIAVYRAELAEIEAGDD